MDCLSPLNMNGFYAHKKPWHPAPWFLNPSRVTEFNLLIQQLNASLNKPTTAAHQGLYMRFSSPYFWQSIVDHPNASEAQSIWENSRLLAYVENSNLIWLIDYALPLLEEYGACALKDCKNLTQRAKNSLWPGSLRHLPSYLEEIHQLEIQLMGIIEKLNTLKTQWEYITQLKIEQQNDVLKLIAKKIDLPSDFTDIPALDNTTMIFLTQTHSNKNLRIPFLTLDKNPPIIAILEANRAFEHLSERLRELKRAYRLLAPEIKPFKPFWEELLNQDNLSYANQFRLKIFKELLNWGSLPILIWLFFQGWISFASMGIGMATWLGFPILAKLPEKIWYHWQKIVYIVKSYLDGLLPDFLIEHAEYVETIERSALWRKNRLAPGCHQMNSFDPNAFMLIYESFQQSLQRKITDLHSMRPPIWQFWRHHTRTLIGALIQELTQEQDALTHYMALYAEDVANRTNEYLLKTPVSLEKINAFVLRFAPQAIDKLNVENKAIDYFLSCIVCDVSSPIQLMRPLTTKKAFASHCPDVVATQSLEAQIKPFIKDPNKLQAILELSKLLQQEKIISLEQTYNHLELLCSPLYPKDKIVAGIQAYLYSTYTGKEPNIKRFFTPAQNRAFNAWLGTQKEDLTHAYRMVNDFLALPPNQDWGLLLTQRTILLRLHYAEQFLNLIQLDGRQDLCEKLKEKILKLAPNYGGKPSVINNWCIILWKGQLPVVLEETILHARFSWTLQEITDNKKNNNLLKYFIKEATETFARADNDHRMSRAFVNEPCFYLPWQAHIQSAVVDLEKSGLLLPQAKAAYSQKGLQQWLQQKP